MRFETLVQSITNPVWKIHHPLPIIGVFRKETHNPCIDDPHTNYLCTSPRKGVGYVSTKIPSHNAQGLYSKYALLSATTEEVNPDFLAITQIWLDSSISDAEFTIIGYTCFRKTGSQPFMLRTLTQVRDEAGTQHTTRKVTWTPKYFRSHQHCNLISHG